MNDINWDKIADDNMKDMEEQFIGLLHSLSKPLPKEMEGGFTGMLFACMREMEEYVLKFHKENDKIFKPKRDIPIYRRMLKALDNFDPDGYKKYLKCYKRKEDDLKILSTYAVINKYD